MTKLSRCIPAVVRAIVIDPAHTAPDVAFFWTRALCHNPMTRRSWPGSAAAAIPFVWITTKECARRARVAVMLFCATSAVEALVDFTAMNLRPDTDRGRDAPSTRVAPRSGCCINRAQFRIDQEPLPPQPAKVCTLDDE
eukprot:1012288-Prymnesium_polylepis.1